MVPINQVHIQAEKPKDMVMHWAINDWSLSPESCRPEGTQQIDDKAVQTPFKDGKSIHLSFPEADCPSRYSSLKLLFTTSLIYSSLVLFRHSAAAGSATQQARALSQAQVAVRLCA